MRRTLHLLTRPEDPLASALLEADRAAGESVVEVIDLSRGEVDYDQLFEAILRADAVQSW